MTALEREREEMTVLQKVVSIPSLSATFEPVFVGLRSKVYLWSAVPS
jgi:hypothetical protein